MLKQYPNETFTIEGDDWHELRSKNIGGSEIAGLFDMSQPYQLTLYGLHMVKSRLVEDTFDGNERTIWGNRLEEAIALGIAEDNGWQVRKGGYFKDATAIGMGSTLDYIIAEDPEYDGPGAFEIKNVDGFVFADKWVNEEPPEHILLQLQHQLAVTGFKWGAIGALIAGNRTMVYKYAARPNLIKEIRRRVSDFWEGVAEGVVPKVDGAETTRDLLRALYTPVTREELDVGDDDSWRETGRAFIDTQKALKEAKKAHDEAKNALIAMLGPVKSVKGTGLVFSQSVTAEKADRVAKPGEIIAGRKESRRYNVKEV